MKRLFLVTYAAAMVAAASALAEDAYIESYGTGSICLGHFAGPNTKIEVDLEMKEVASDVSVFGSTGAYSTTTTTPMFRMYIGNPGDGRPRYSWEYTASDGSRAARNVDVASPGERRTIAFDAVTHTYTSVAYGSETGSSWSFEGKTCLNTTSARPLAVFGACENSFAASTNHFTVRNYPVKMKCYGVKIYESGTLVKNFVPCVKGGIAGLKETINNRFVTGADVEALGYGGDILVEKDDPYVSTIVNTNSIYLANSRLAGTSIYFLTGYYMKKNSRLELDYALLTPHWSPDKLHGAFLNLITAGSGSQKMYISTYGSSATRGDYYCNVGSYADAERIYAKTEHDIRRTVTVVSNGYDFITAGYTNISKRSTKGIISDLTSYQVKLACSQSNDTGFMPMKIYGLKIYEDDQIIKDFRPFVTNGVPGLIDILNPSDQRFATTYLTSGVTTNRMAEAGGDLERDGYTAAAESEAYLEFPGYGNGIDTGYKVPHNAVVEADFALWSAKSNDSQAFISQGASPYITLSWVSGAYWWKFADTSGNTDGFIPALSTERLQYRLDSNAITIKRGEATPVSRTKNWTSTTESGNDTMKIGSSNAAMRLYRFRVLVGGDPVHDFVPCVKNGQAGLYDRCTGTFKALAGGRVFGKGYKGQSGEFEVLPKSAFLREGDSPATLSCLAVGATGYEWYRDGEMIDGETGDSLSVEWTRGKPYVHVYSVVPVYTVFGETVRGGAVSTTVECNPRGSVLTIR